MKDRRTLFGKVLDLTTATVIDGEIVWTLNKSVSPLDLFYMIEKGLEEIKQSEALDNH